MKNLINSLCLAALCATAGCGQNGVEAKFAELMSINADLRDKLESANQRIEATDAKVASLESEMQAFAQAYDAEQREQLAQNIQSVGQFLEAVQGDADTASKALSAAETLKAEIESLRDLCRKYESEAKDANQVGLVKASLVNLEQSVNSLERSLESTPDIGSKVRSLESKIRQVESSVRQVESKVRRIP